MPNVSYKESVAHDLKRFDPPTAVRLVSKIEQVLARHPDAGDPLKGEFRGLFRYRIGDYRVIYTKIPDGILILRIAHRRDASPIKSIGRPASLGIP